MKFLKIILLICLLSGCQAIEKKSQKTIKAENEKLSKFIQKPQSELKIVLGEPDEVTYAINGTQFFTYIKKKYNIICERKFEIDQSGTVIGFTSKGCF